MTDKALTPALPPKIITYVVAGDDWDGDFKGEVNELAQRQDVVVLRPKPGESLETTLGEIKPPAQVILAAHGSDDGHFAWNQQDAKFLNYGDFLRALPAGVACVYISSCYGETAQTYKDAIKPGTILFSAVSSKASSLSTDNYAFGLDFGAGPKNKSRAITPCNIILHSLDSVDPVSDSASMHNQAIDFATALHDNPQLARRMRDDPEFAQFENASGLAGDASSNPADVMPHLISIGGNPPLSIDLNSKVGDLANEGRVGSLNKENFDKAIAMVKDQCEGMSYAGLGEPSIDSVAVKIEQGVDPATFSVSEKRIAYALAVANMETSGEFSRLVDIQKSQSASTQEQGETAAPDAAQWDGKGSQNIAEFQAILKLGAKFTEQVTGVMNDQTRLLIAFEEQKYHIRDDDAEHSKLLQALLHDKYVIKALGMLKDGNGQNVARMPSLATSTPAVPTQSALPSAQR